MFKEFSTQVPKRKYSQENKIVVRAVVMFNELSAQVSTEKILTME